MKNNYIRYCLAFAAVALASVANAQQTDRDCIRQGNRHFRSGEMDKAVTYYQKAIEKHPTVEAYFNLGCASQDSTTLESYMKAESLGFTNVGKRAMNFHNMGNIWYLYTLSRIRSNDSNLGKYLDAAIESYKSALRCNPNDNETRYNLAMAQWLKKNGSSQQQQQQQQQDQQQQQQQQQQQEQQKKDKKEEKKDEMSDEVIEQLLKSAQQDEKDVQKKVNAQPSRRRSLEKDW